VITDRPRPLPDCALCGTPTKRRVHRANGGMCTDCARAYAAGQGEQQQLPLVVPAPGRTPPDLTNVVVLVTRRRKQ
jgi:hypothetical protein